MLKSIKNITSRLIVLLGVTASAASMAADPRLDWRTFETEHFEIHYPQELKPLVQTVAYESERAHKRLVPYLEWSPEQKTQVVMVDDFDPSNGSATPIPNNTMMLIMQPPTDGELADYDSWLRLLITHEYAHILHLDKAIGTPDFLRNIFGRFFLLFPNMLHPNWFQEGFATHIETDTELGIGRGQADVFQMMMRQETIHGLKNVGEVNTIFSHDWPLNHAYLYGVYFMQFMEERYGKDAIKKLIRYYSDNLIPFRVDSNPKLVTGKSLTYLWPEFEAYLTERFAQQVAKIKQQSVTETVRLVEDGYTYGSPEVDQQGTIWFTGRDGYHGATLYRQVNGETEAVSPLNSNAKLAINQNNELVLSQLEYCDEYRLYYDLYRVSDGELERLTECGRYRDVSWKANKELIALKYEVAVPKIDLLTNDGYFVRQIWSGVAGDVVGGIDVDSSGTLFAAIKFNLKSWDLYRFDSGHWVPLTQDAEIQMNPSVRDGWLYFIEASQGQLDAYKMPVGGGDKVRLTNLLTGATEVKALSNDQLLLTEYTHNGYRISKTQSLAAASEAPVMNQPAQTFEGIEQVEGAESSYSPVSTLLPTFWLPAFAVGDINHYGAFTQGNDAAGFHIYNAQVTYATDYETPLALINYSYDGKLFFGYNKQLTLAFQSQFTSFGSDVAEEKEDISLAMMKPLISIQQRWYGFLGGVHSTTSLIAKEDDIPSSAKQQLESSGFNEDWLVAGVISDSLETDLFQGDFSRGSVIQFNVESASIGTNDVEDGEVYLLDSRFHLPVFDTHVLAQRFVLGLGEEENTPFKLGGYFADSYIGPSLQLNKRSFALRGYPDGEPDLRNDQMALYSLEYRFPFSWHDESLMSSLFGFPLGFQGWSSRVFMDVGSVWAEGESPEKAYTGIGAELILDNTVFYYLPFRLRVGVAQGLDEQGEYNGYIQAGGAF